MWSSILDRFRFAFRPKTGVSVSQDANDLVEIFGSDAYDAAAKMAWRHDIGLLEGSRPGHWALVQSEVARRIGMVEAESPQPMGVPS